MIDKQLLAKPVVPVTLVTTVFNESHNIEAFLLSYYNQSVRAREFIIVDGGSNDGTVDKIQYFTDLYSDLKIHIIIDGRCNRKYVKGPIAKGRNIAISYAREDWIVVTDAGCELAHDWLSVMYAGIQQNQCDIISGWYEPLQGSSFQSLYAESALLKVTQVDPDTFLPSSRNIAFKKSCWLQVGGYPEMTYTAEDTLYDLKLKRAGFTFFFLPASVVFWVCPRSLGEAWNKQVRYGEGDGYLRLFVKRAILGYIKIFFPLGSLIRIYNPRLAFLKYLLLVANQYGYTKGIIKSFL